MHFSDTLAVIVAALTLLAAVCVSAHVPDASQPHGTQWLYPG